MESTSPSSHNKPAGVGRTPSPCGPHVVVDHSVLVGLAPSLVLAGQAVALTPAPGLCSVFECIFKGSDGLKVECGTNNGAIWEVSRQQITLQVVKARVWAACSHVAAPLMTRRQGKSSVHNQTASVTTVASEAQTPQRVYT